jgi:hypothetical protein
MPNHNGKLHSNPLNFALNVFANQTSDPLSIRNNEEI